MNIYEEDMEFQNLYIISTFNYIMLTNDDNMMEHFKDEQSAYIMLAEAYTILDSFNYFQIIPSYYDRVIDLCNFYRNKYRKTGITEMCNNVISKVNQLKNQNEMEKLTNRKTFYYSRNLLYNIPLLMNESDSTILTSLAFHKAVMDNIILEKDAESFNRYPFATLQVFNELINIYEEQEDEKSKYLYNYMNDILKQLPTKEQLRSTSISYRRYLNSTKKLLKSVMVQQKVKLKK